MEDVLDVYQRPRDPARPLVCLDETGKALQATPRGQRPLRPGQPVRQDYEYVRQGSCNLFLAVAPLLGWRKVRVTGQRTGDDLAEQLRQLVEEDFPDAENIVLVTHPTDAEFVLRESADLLPTVRSLAAQHGQELPSFESKSGVAVELGHPGVRRPG